MAHSFKDKMRKKGTLIVDVLNLCFRWKHQGRNDYRYEFEHTVNSLATSYRSDQIILTADWGSSTYRKGIYPDYKADRRERYKDQTEQEKMAFEEFFEEYEQTLKTMEADGYIVLRYKGVEADDLAAHLVNNREQYELENIWLVSSDRDWDLLVQEGVSRFSYVTRKEITETNWAEHYDVPRDEYISLKVIQGDKGDNVPGFKGIGPVRAATLVETHGTAMDIYDQLPMESKYKFMEDLNENPERILLNYELMDLVTYCDDAIGTENIMDIKGKMGDVPW
jgi:5'-3' exonuclease